MNFFEHQDKARKQSRWLILMFIIAVLAVVAAIDLILLIVLGVSAAESGEWQSFSAEGVRQNAGLLIGGAVASVAVIGIASLFKTARLRSGGGQVARELGGTLVESDARDPLRRRLRNVVEEIALASGVPVPEIYVLEKEGGINAFAAGYSPSDAAIAVTRGTLERLNRNELQGVIAHEFSHILNGDMRVNIRLMGALFGILLLALIGRRVLMHSHHIGRSRDKNGAAILLIAFGLMAIGYIGQFFGRWIKAAISRQREYLADASAVQFTRDPDGIGGALKKIAVFSNGSFMAADTEEISHMLFGNGRKMLLFATHPKITDRISRVDPGFRPEELDQLRAKMELDASRQREQADKERRLSQKNAAKSGSNGPGGGMFDVGNLIDHIGQPHWERILMAATLAAAIPENVRQAAQSSEWAPEVLFYSLLDNNREIREQQLLLIAKTMGHDSEAQVRALVQSGGVPSDSQRLPLLELGFTALKRRPAEFISKMLNTVDKLVRLDGRIDVFEYLLARLIAQYLWESQNPKSARLAGSKRLSGQQQSCREVLAVLARHGAGKSVLDNARTEQGSSGSRNGPEAAYRAGLEVLGLAEDSDMPRVSDWAETLDNILPALDRLRASDKEKLVKAMVTTVSHDGQLLPQELELLRVVCSLIHVPLPLLNN